MPFVSAADILRLHLVGDGLGMIMQDLFPLFISFLEDIGWKRFVIILSESQSEKW
jgi:hypothetical protein